MTATGFDLDLDEALGVARRAALAAGTVIREGWGRRHRVAHKGAIDLVTEADLAAEEAIRGILGEAYPSHGLLMEESGEVAGGGGDAPRWVVDPLDGTTNYAHGFPMFAVSIALEVAGRVRLGVVLDVPRFDLYEAVEGGGGRVGEVPLRVSSTPSLEAALLATGFPYDRRTSPDNNLDRFTAFFFLAHGVRRTGAASLDLAFVARGFLDGYWETKLRPWDTAAGALLVREAGGRVTGFRGEPHSLEDGRIVASNGRIHDSMLDVIGRVEARAGRLGRG